MFTPNDLVSGLFVKLRNGDLGVVACNRIVLQKGSYIDVYNYTDDLHCSVNADCDIMEVRGFGTNGYIDCFNNFNRMSLRYERASFTLNKIKDGDIVTVKHADGTTFDFYKCADLLLPIDNTVGAYNLCEFEEKTLRFQC